MCINSWKEIGGTRGNVEDRGTVFSVVPRDRTRGNVRKPKYTATCKNPPLLLCSWLNTETVFSERLLSLFPWRHLKPNWTLSEEPAPADGASAGGLD